MGVQNVTSNEVEFRYLNARSNALRQVIITTIWKNFANTRDSDHKDKAFPITEETDLSQICKNDGERVRGMKKRNQDNVT